MLRLTYSRLASAIVILTATTSSGTAAPVDPNQIKNEHGRIVEFWTPARRAAAKPRDFVINNQGRAFLKASATQLVPYNQNQIKPLKGKPSGGSTGGGSGGTDTGSGGGSTDTSGTEFANLFPSVGVTIGGSQTFSAQVSDSDGIKSVSFELTAPNGSIQQYSASAPSSGNTYSINFSGFTDGDWSWRVISKDGAKRGGNTGYSETVQFKVEAETIVNEAAWPESKSSADVQQASGRILFMMGGSYYVCSGTVVNDGTFGRSLILTAAHCIYDDVEKEFATNVLFIPNQDQTAGTRSDTNCSNDPIGCWTTKFAVVDEQWTVRTFPENLDWDHGYYIVDDTGSHSSGLTDPTSIVLDQAVPALSIQTSTPVTGSYTHALGYSYSEDPSFRYCAMDLSTISAAVGTEWWLDTCDLSGGASGGPWVQPLDEATGAGPIISVNSWGYTTRAGMAGPRLDSAGARCLLDMSKTASVSADSPDGEVLTCY